MRSMRARKNLQTHPYDCYLRFVCRGYSHGTDGDRRQEQVRTAELGDGPVDATLKAIKKLTKTKAKLQQYNVGSITGGTDAQGEVPSVWRKVPALSSAKAPPLTLLKPQQRLT